MYVLSVIIVAAGCECRCWDTAVFSSYLNFAEETCKKPLRCRISWCRLVVFARKEGN